MFVQPALESSVALLPGMETGLGRPCCGPVQGSRTVEEPWLPLSGSSRLLTVSKESQAVQCLFGNTSSFMLCARFYITEKE